jgi:hypothetical protein
LERTDGVFDTRVGGSPFQNAAALTHRFHIGAELTARTKISDDARTKLADQLGL